MIGLEPLLAALREAGLPVGVAEMARLQRVFALSPEPGGPRLQSVLRAVLVKSADDRAVFERVFETWLLQADHEVRLRDEAPQAQLEPVRAPRPRHRRIRWAVPALVALVLWSLVLGGHVKVNPREEIEKVAPPPGPGKEKKETPEPPPDQPRTFTVLVPVLTVAPGPWPGWLPLGFAVAALATAAGLWWSLRGRSWFPEAAPEPARKGPPRVFLSPLEPAGLQLLLPREEEALVWGIGHFIAEEPTRRLDLPATVRATAQAAGFPHLRFHLARHPREVWLWIDEAADDPAIPRLAEEVATALAAHGLPIERALFRGVPDRLVQEDGQAFAPNEVDERRDAALVAILTDGRILARRYAADDQRMGLDALLRSLSFWPRLAFVDFSPEAGALSALLAPHFLERITPPELPGFLGADETLRRRALMEDDGAAIWAAACALAPSPVDEAQAFELRRRLGLTDSPWAIRALRTEAPGPAGRLQWPPPLRARRVNWLRAAEAQSEDGLDPGSLLGQALTFWEEVYGRELQERAKGQEGALWKDTPAHQHLRMERALLALWRKDGAPGAIRELHSLHGGPLRKPIEERLERLAPLDRGGEDLVHLPWRWAARTGAEPAMLLDMRLGGGMPPVTLRRPGRLWLGLALCLGLLMGALAGALLRRPAGPPKLSHGPGKPADAGEEARELTPGTWRVTVTAGTEAATRDVPTAARVAVRWTEETRTTCRNGDTANFQGVKFVHVCPGTFRMGSVAGEENEKPDHEVTLNEYWIGQTEVTEEQYGDTREASKLPVTNVTWFNARDFCERRGWRLPTEAEWENAARAGTTTAWSFGDDEKALGDYAWFGEDFRGQPHPVGTKEPNPWGLYDMHGNVWEWVADWYGRYDASPQIDPKGPATGDYRVLRGGAFDYPPGGLRSADRFGVEPENRSRNIGFRCARSPGRQP